MGVVQDREQEARKRMADIQKKKKEILKDREDKVLEHMDKVEVNLKANRDRLKKELEIKAELEKIKYEQAKDNVAREKARPCTHESGLLYTLLSTPCLSERLC